MTLKTITTAALLSAASVTASFAAPVNIEFEAHELKGTFFGLDTAKRFSIAKAYEFSTTQAEYSGPPPIPDRNFFAFRDGEFFFPEFWIREFFSTDGEFKAQINITSRFIHFSEENASSGGDRANFTGPFVPIIVPLAPVPLPSGSLLLLSGLACAVLFKRRKTRIA